MAPDRAAVAAPGVRTAGFVGIGDQGEPIAGRNLAGGFPLAVWARRPDSMARLLAAGATAASTPVELGRACDYVGLCVTTDDDVAEVVETLLPAMRPGSLLAIHATVSPAGCEELARICAQRDVRFLDAPVSGGRKVAEAGALTVMCGGDAADLAYAMPVLATFSDTIIHAGPAGCGQKAKIVNNSLLTANLGTAVAAIRAGEALGLDRDTLLEVLGRSSGYSRAIDICRTIPAGGTMSDHGAAILTKDAMLLQESLPGDANAAALLAAARQFFGAALPRP